MTEIKNVVVVGAGAMGSQIGLLCALAGYSASITDISQEALDRAETALRQRMSRDIEKNRRTAADVDAAFGRLSFSTDLLAAAAAADFVIEAAVEKLAVKRRLFADLDRVAPATRDPGHQLLQHRLLPDRRRHRATGPGLQRALLQPRAGHEVRRGGPRTRHI